jgi:hypothetical protein
MHTYFSMLSIKGVRHTRECLKHQVGEGGEGYPRCLLIKSSS